LLTHAVFALSKRENMVKLEPMKPYFLFITLFSGFAALAATKGKTVKVAATPTPDPAVSNRTLKYYEVGKTDGPILYTQKIQIEKLANATVSTKSVVTNPKGDVVFTEAVISKGSMPLSQSADVQQTKRHLELEVKDDQVYLRTRALTSDPTSTEQPKEDHEKLPNNFITGALAENFVIEHFDELLAGETVAAKMAIMEIRELVTFKFWKKEALKENGRDVVIIAMKPSSIFISFLVDTIYLHIDLKAKKMVHYVGRTPLWKDVDGKLKALDAEIVFE